MIALDDARNDIYIHVDKKTKDVPFEQLQCAVTKASLKFIKRMSVNWGGYSQISVELALLKAATKTCHSYYHLISGVDFPLKSQNEIHEFFKVNKGKEFIRFDPNSSRAEEFRDRARYYYFFQDKIGRNRGKLVAFYSVLQEKLLWLQKKMKVDRTQKCSEKIYKGTQWFSITHDLATYVMRREKYIRKHFKYGFCVDELFLQTVAMASPYRENIADDSLRYIDWKRGNPYTFTCDDYEVLIRNENLFARKFDDTVDSMIVDKLFDYIHCRTYEC